MARSVFIMPPSLSALEQRLKARRQDSEETIARRMLDAKKEMAHRDEYDFVIQNDNFEIALRALQEILNNIEKGEFGIS